VNVSRLVSSLSRWASLVKNATRQPAWSDEARKAASEAAHRTNVTLRLENYLNVPSVEKARHHAEAALRASHPQEAANHHDAAAEHHWRVAHGDRLRSDIIHFTTTLADPAAVKKRLRIMRAHEAAAGAHQRAASILEGW